MTSLPSAGRRGTRGQAWDTDLERRALALWPRLGRSALRRCGHDPERVAALVSRRTNLEIDTIRRVLMACSVTDDEVATWFG